jgi:hypothetical protein
MVARMSPKLVVKEGLCFLYVMKRLRIFTVVDSQDSSKSSQDLATRLSGLGADREIRLDSLV